MDEYTKTLKKVVAEWGLWEIFWMIVFFPWSLLYLVLRIVQEWDNNE